MLSKDLDKILTVDAPQVWSTNEYLPVKMEIVGKELRLTTDYDDSVATVSVAAFERALGKVDAVKLDGEDDFLVVYDMSYDIVVMKK